VLKEIKWAWKSFQEFSTDELYEILSFRQEIFSVEQESWYLDADGLDQDAVHLLGINEHKLVAYLRLIKPKLLYSESSLGRILVHRDFRADGLGHYLVDEGKRKSLSLFPGEPIRISAQEHLEKFYNGHGFNKEGEVYDEDGIPHVSMVTK
jgi:ElaA protein|tara:strand:- start:4509 stop:4961 length:453 start_codon:yes stop_codon:yes gene_type:complete